MIKLSQKELISCCAQRRYVVHCNLCNEIKCSTDTEQYHIDDFIERLEKDGWYVYDKFIFCNTCMKFELINIHEFLRKQK